VESYTPVPHALGGEQTPIANKRRNAERWREVEAFMRATLRHQFDLARDIKVSRNPLPGEWDDPRKRKIDGTVVDRVTGEPWTVRKPQVNGPCCATRW
jgi:hypothetical protein